MAARESSVERELEALAERLGRSTVAVRLGRGAAGSGVIWGAGGTVVTNAHVATAPTAEVVLGDGRRFVGRVERRDPSRDLALLRIDADGLPAVEPGDPAELRTGELVVAVGHPLGVPNAVSMGIVHAPVASNGRRFVQADLRLAPGNSGGPLADARGRVVGINSMVAGGVALAVPADDVQRFAGAAQPAPLGVALAAGRLRDGATVLVVVAIEPGSRAERAGLRVGDLLPARDPGRLRFMRTLEVVRAGARVRLAIPQEHGSPRAA